MERDRAARAICVRCPVIAECAAHAIKAREPYGVWGGMSEDVRAALFQGDLPLAG
jgi:WhiB family redox-sensing transcriptional regulator